MRHNKQHNIRNVAIIAHVDHGKTTLVDGLLRQSGQLAKRDFESDRIMDSFDLERERGITILAKNTAVDYQGTRINILDTPGHHDFGGEVERTLVMADGVLLLVDAAEGPLPQTRFVLQKAMEQELPVVLAINKIDRSDARPAEVLDEVYGLFIELGADDSQLDFPVLYTNARLGTASADLADPKPDLRILLDTLLEHIPAPANHDDEPLVIHVSNLGWDDYVGRLILGRIHKGQVNVGQQIELIGEGGQRQPGKVMRLYGFSGLDRVEIDQARSGNIVAIAGIEHVEIGDTIVDEPETQALPRIRVDEPTLSMNFCVNTGPLAGLDGQYVTSRNIRDRLYREDKANVAIRVEDTDSADKFRVVGRGELQLAILVETLRREGYELMLSRPEVVERTIDGQRHEPLERLIVECPIEFHGAVSEALGPRKARLEEMKPSMDRVELVYLVPTRGLIGLHSQLLTDTRGTALIHTLFDGWIPWQGDIQARRTGSLVADRAGTTRPYALFHLQPRGTLFVGPNTTVYEGMVVGETNRPKDLDVNVTREKKLTNMRAAAKDENVILTPHRKLSLEQSIEFINDDELVEVTPQIFRIRKKELTAGLRHKQFVATSRKRR